MSKAYSNANVTANVDNRVIYLTGEQTLYPNECNTALLCAL